ncbi:MAG: class I SAM-dependent methyltransferase [Brevundimonas sp.]|nr:class I SAM-dependent methyltransferase [Brevundimonas sp.]
MNQSRPCRQTDFETPWFSNWSERLGERLRYHRKLWEFVFIAQALHERRQLRAGARGLGFGVGREPLAAYFASRGCRIMGTDLAPEQAADAGWTATDQHAEGKAALMRPDLCDPEVFEAAVDFRVVDMNAIPDDLTGYDFCWSACALEHLGSLEAGMAFIERSIDTLQPGGFAIHTTELNLTSDVHTLETGGTVLYRRRDLSALAERLTAAGHTVAPLDFDAGSGPVDSFVDIPPYLPEPHLRLALAGFATTSFGLIIQKAGQP